MDTNETNGEKIAGTNLTTIPEYSDTALGLRALQEKHKNVIYDVTVPAQMKAAKEARKELVKLRTSLENKRKEIKAPALELCQRIDAEAKRLTSEIKSLEDPIDAQIIAEETRIEAERAAAALAEQARIDAHKENIQKLRDFPLSLQGKPSSVINSRIESFKQNWESVNGDAYEEFSREAQDAYGAALLSAYDLHARAKADEAERERVAAQEEENRRLQQEVENLRREKAEREERSRREQAEREANERRRVDAIRAEIDAIKNIPANITSMKASEVREEIEGLEILNPRASRFDFAEFRQEAEEVYDSTMVYLQQVHVEAQRRDEQEQLDILRRAEEQAELDRQRESLRREQERQDRERREHAAQVERDRIAKLGLMDAVRAVVDYVEKGNSDVPRCILDLCEVYYSLPAEKKQAAKPVKKAVQ